MTYAFGGPEEYKGKNMWKAHEKLVRDQGLNDNHFNIIVKHLVGALQKFNVPEVSLHWYHPTAIVLCALTFSTLSV